METDHNQTQSNKALFIGLLVIALVAIATAGGFASGVHYQKGRTPAASVAGANTDGPQFFQNGNGPNGAMSGSLGNDTIGTVSAISASSITVQDQHTGASKTYAITSATQIVKDGTTAAYSDITTNSTVLLTADSKNTGNALHITVDPSLGHMGGPGTIQTN
jgi:hypothetical protein